MNNVFETVRKYRTERTIEVDGEMVVMRVDGQMDMQKKTWQVSRRRTTKINSHNPDQNKAILQQYAAMETEMVEKLEALRAELGPDDEDEPNLFNRDHEYEFPTDGSEEDENDETGHRRIDFETGAQFENTTRRTRKVATQNETESVGEGGPDDENNPDPLSI